MPPHSRAVKADIPQILSRLPLFQELAPQQVERIAEHSRERRLVRGEMLFQKGDTASGFFVLILGQIKLAFPSATGNEKVVEVLGPRQTFGEAAMFMDRTYPVFAEAIVDCLVVHVGAQGILPLLAEDSVFARRMLAGLSQRLHHLMQDVESYSQRSSAQRVLGYLIQLCPEDADGSQEISFDLPISKQLIASRLNLTPETLSRIFHDLSDEGLIGVHGKHVKVLDLLRLKEFQG
jgi:CRP-like cAMP-binding protein